MSLVAVALRSPFKGLAAFDDSEIDALLFFGRERETEEIVANLFASDLTVLYGPSGVGKSSILRAGVSRRLRELAGDAEVVIRDEWSADPSLPKPEGEAFLILDQLEEYFLYHDEGPLLEQLPVLLAQPRVHVLISLREDALAQLDTLELRVPNVFSNRLRLGHLDALAARAAIVRPLDSWNAVAEPADQMKIEAALVDAVLTQVAVESETQGASASARIEAPYLQLVMERIWDEERSAGSTLLRAETLSRLGGARAVVSAHLERALSGLPPREAEIATNALKFLVTPSRMKIAHSLGDLVGFTNESPVELRSVLELLASQRILRAVTQGDVNGRRYEIFHDVLAEPVLEWRREFEAQAAVEREREAAKRRHRRTTAIAAFALLLAAAMAALAVWALGQRNEASLQRRKAEQQTQIALHQREFAQEQQALFLAQKQRAIRARRAALASALRANASKEQAQASAAEANASEQQAQQSAQQASASEAKAQQSAQQANASKAEAQEQRRIAEGKAAAEKRASRRAMTASRRATIGELVATSTADLGRDPEESVRDALRASDLASTNPVEDALRSSLVALRLRAILDAGGGAVNSATFSPDGKYVATGAQGGEVRLFDARTHALVHELNTRSPVEQVFGTRTHALVHELNPRSPVERVVFAPDGSTLVAATRNGRALLYDVRSGDLLKTFHHGGRVLAAVFAGGGRYLVTGSADRTLRVWDVASGDELHAIAGTRAVVTIAVSRDGSLVAAVSPGDPVGRVYDVASGNLVASVAQPGEVTGAAFSPDGRYLVTTGSRNGSVWDTRSWSLLHLLSGHEAAITDVVFAPDGRVVTSSVDGSARIWDPATGAYLPPLLSHQQKVLAVAVSPDGSEIATASADETARVWGPPPGSTPFELAGHTDAVTATAFSPDGSLLLTAGADGSARLWDPTVKALAPLGSEDGAVAAVSYNPSGSLVLSGGADGTARLWDAHGALVRTLQHGGHLTHASFIFAGRDVLTASDDGTAKLWRVSDGSALATFAHGAPVRAAVADRTHVYTAGDDGFIRSWTLDGKPAWSAHHGSPIGALVESSRGVLATGAADGTIRLWDASTGSALRTLRGHSDEITSLAFGADGTLLVSGSADHTARIWRVRDGDLLHTLAGHVFGVTSVAFSPDSKLVLTGSVDGDARLWDVKNGQNVHRLKFHVATVSQAAFSSDGRWVVTAGPTSAAIWNTRTGSLLYFLRGARGRPTTVAFAPDSQRIVIGDTGGGIETFRCVVCAGIPALQAQARARLAALR